MRSIRLSLLKWLLLPLLAVNLLAGALMYHFAWNPAQVAFDANLANEAWALIPRLQLEERSVELDLSHQAEEMLRIDRFDAVYFVVRDGTGRTIAGDKDFPTVAQPAKLDVPETYDQQMRGTTIRVASLKTMIASHPVVISVGETLRKRDDIRSEIVFKVVGLQILVTSLLMAMSWLAVSRGLRPLQKIRNALNARRYDDLSPVAEKNLPSELQPLAEAIDSLLNRTETGAKAQQDFLANVAHQLRTPLAGLKTQLEWLQQKYATEPDAEHSCGLMMSSIDRMIRQSNQLLALARVEPSQFERRGHETIELHKLVEETIQHFVREAARKEIDLGFDLHPTRVTGDRFVLRDLIDNLMDNAIRYTPRGGMVTVSCFENAGRGTLTVEDNGPGIPPADREKVFNRFYRLDHNVAGTGLGLAIVRDIATGHDAEIEITSGDGGKGTIFSVRFPLRADA
jgi:two-component system sensor histidine kinase TctE